MKKVYPEFISNYLTESKIKEVWDKTQLILGKKKEEYRIDRLKKIIKYSEHGNHLSPNGWIVDFIVPPNDGGSLDVGNLQALNCQHILQIQNKLT